MANTKITTPKGTALYPHLRRPETYEGAEVGYTIQMRFSKEDTDKLIEALENELEAAKDSSEFKGKKWQNARIGTKEDKNGDIVFKFKTKTSYKTKAGDIVQRTVPVVDAKGKIFKGDIGTGSICKVRFATNPYHKSASNCGLTLYLEAVQVIEFKEPGGFSMESLGFEVEDGFSVEDTNDMPDAVNNEFENEEF